MTTKMIIDEKGNVTFTIETNTTEGGFKRMLDFVTEVTASSRMHQYQIEALEYLKVGLKLQAVKLWKETLGMGLKESKDAVEAFAHRELPLLYDKEGRFLREVKNRG